MKHSVAIYEKSVQKISEELLPENIVKKEDINSNPVFQYTKEDEGSFLQVVDGKPTWVKILSQAEEVEF